MILNDIERAVLCGAREYRTNNDFIDAIEAAVIQKLSKGWVMPDALPAISWQHHMYTESQLREAFAAGAALNTPDSLAEHYTKLNQHCAMLENKLAAMEARREQPDYWQEEARRYAGNADYWRERCKAQEKT